MDVTPWLPLADSLAARLAPGDDDARGEAQLRLVECGVEFDPSRGVAFGHYAKLSITAALRRWRARERAERCEQLGGEAADAIESPVADCGDECGDDAAACLALLRPVARRAVELRFGFHGPAMGYREIGRELGCSTNRAQVIVEEALATMRVRSWAGPCLDGWGESGGGLLDAA